MARAENKLIKNGLSSRINVRKAAYSVMIASWLQIIASLLLAVLYFTGNSSISTSVMVLVLIPLVIIGNALLMRNSWSVLLSKDAQTEMMQTMTGIDELNRKLRAQRHDFINHLQVVHSLIQLQEYDDAAKYIANTYEDIRQVGELLKTANPAVNGLLAAKKQKAAENNINLEFHITARIERAPIPDWELCRVLSNLLDNAIYAAAEVAGSVHVTLREDIHSIYFSIENSGNINNSVLSKIFEPGFTTKGEKGTGMGLYIVKETIEKYSGQVTFETGEGTTRFYGYIPASHKNITSDI
ncbi:MAG: Spo0B domain-containing protein [Clostridia bacterium]|nr:Spo0B domain-containing protein [Clostridia bacterium]